MNSITTSKFLSPREQAIVRGTWKINKEEREKLDRFFLVHGDWMGISDDFTYDEVEYKRFLVHEGKEYEVILMKPVRILRTARQLGLSFRVHNATGIRVVLINEWYAEESTDSESIENGAA